MTPRANELLRGEGYGSTDFRNAIAGMGVTAVIPLDRSRPSAIPYDKHILKERHLVECLINKIKQFRRLATRHDKTAASFSSILSRYAGTIRLR